MKTVVLGIDGLDLRHLERHASSLSTIAALGDRGVAAALESTHPQAIGCAWPSLYTGTGPGHHGVYGAVAYDGYPDEPRAVSRIDVRRPAIWDYLSSEGAASIVVDVPVTHPADPIRGVLVPAASPAGLDPGHPTGIRAELGEPFADRSADRRAGVGTLASSIDRRRRAFLRLLEDADWELALLRVGELDDALEAVDREADLRPLYEAVDRIVRDVLGAIDERTNVVVCSTRGAGPVDGYRIALDEVLREAGFLDPTPGDEPATPSFEVDTPATGYRESLRRTLRAGLESTLARLGVGSTDDRVDWYTSLAYCPDAASGGVRVNLAGREPCGTVAPSRYEAVRDELVDLFSALETPDGEPAFEFVCRREHLYEGGFLEDAPDVLVAPASGHELSAGLPGGRFEPVETVGPNREGAFVGVGPSFERRSPLHRLSVVDLAPIVVASLGRPVPSLMTGSVPDGLLVDPAIRARYDDLVYGGAATDPYFDDGDVRSRLEDVGFR